MRIAPQVFDPAADLFDHSVIDEHIKFHCFFARFTVNTTTSLISLPYTVAVLNRETKNKPYDIL